MLFSKAQLSEAGRWGGICALLLIAQAVLPMGLDVIVGVAMIATAGYGGWRSARA